MMSINRAIKYAAAIGLAVTLQPACFGTPKKVPAKPAAKPAAKPVTKPTAPVKKAQVAGKLMLSPGAAYGPQLYNSWPLMFKVVLWRELPEGNQTAKPLTVKAKQGAWQDALVVTVKTNTGTVVKWPLHIVKQSETSVTLDIDDSAQAEWWLTPEETKAISEGEYIVSVAFDVKKLTEDPMVTSDEYCIRVAKEPSPLNAEAKQDKDLELAHLALLQGDTAAASAIVQKVLVSDPKSIGGNRMNAILLVKEGKTREALTALDTALDSYAAKYPKACPPAGILSQRAEILGKIKPEVKPE